MYQSDRKRVAGFKNYDWFPQMAPCKSSHTGGLRWMGIPGGFAAYTAGAVDGHSRRLCGMYRRGPGRYSD
jgi:hypothetical protein